MASHTEDKFTEKISGIVTNAYLTVGLAIGRELGLFTAMADIDKPATSTEIAAKAGCKERLVREWLHQMAVGGILDLTETGPLFYLPPDRRPGIMSGHTVLAGFLPTLLKPHDQLMSVFREDGPAGLSSESIANTFAYWEKSRPEFFELFMPKAIEMIKGLNKQLELGINVVDIGCGKGHLCHWLATTYPNSTFTGIDITADSIAEANVTASRKGLSNVSFEVVDAGNLPRDMTGQIDLVVLSDVLHDLPNASKVVSEIYMILKKGGMLLIIEFRAHANPKDNLGDPLAIKLLTFSMYYCLSSAMCAPDSEELGTCAGIETFESLLENGGFNNKFGAITANLGSDHLLIARRK